MGEGENGKKNNDSSTKPYGRLLIFQETPSRSRMFNL